MKRDIIITYLAKNGTPCGDGTSRLPLYEGNPMEALRFYRDQCGAKIEGRARDILQGRVEI